MDRLEAAAELRVVVAQGVEAVGAVGHDLAHAVALEGLQVRERQLLEVALLPQPPGGVPGTALLRAQDAEAHPGPAQDGDHRLGDPPRPRVVGGGAAEPVEHLDVGVLGQGRNAQRRGQTLPRPVGQPVGVAAAARFASSSVPWGGSRLRVTSSRRSSTIASGGRTSTGQAWTQAAQRVQAQTSSGATAASNRSCDPSPLPLRPDGAHARQRFRTNVRGESALPLATAGHARSHEPHSVQAASARRSFQPTSSADATPTRTSRAPPASSSRRSNGVRGAGRGASEATQRWTGAVSRCRKAVNGIAATSPRATTAWVHHRERNRPTRSASGSSARTGNAVRPRPAKAQEPAPPPSAPRRSASRTTRSARGRAGRQGAPS